MDSLTRTKSNVSSSLSQLSTNGGTPMEMNHHSEAQFMKSLDYFSLGHEDVDSQKKQVPKHQAAEPSGAIEYMMQPLLSKAQSAKYGTAATGQLLATSVKEEMFRKKKSQTCPLTLPLMP